jgi:hypothetical protein
MHDYSTKIARIGCRGRIARTIATGDARNRPWEAAPFGCYFANTALLVLGIMAGQFVICTLAAFGLACWKSYSSKVLFALILVQVMVTPDVLILENLSHAAEARPDRYANGHRLALCRVPVRHLPVAADRDQFG